MPTLFSHIYIPLTILFIFSNGLKLDQRLIIILSLFGTLPDIDIFLFHRASLHNIFILIIPILIFLLTKDRKIRYIAGIICTYLGSHIILDIFNGGAFILYPFYNNVFFVQAEIIFHYVGITPILNYGISKDIVNNGIGEPMISSENIGIMILLIIFTLLFIVKNQYKKQ